MIVARVMHGVRGHLAHRFSEWVFAAILGVFSMILLGPSKTFETSTAYATMASIMSETAWGYTLGAVAVVRLLALGINGSFDWFRPYSPAVRAFTAWLSAAAWFCLSIGFFYGNASGTGWGVYGVIFLADVCLALRIAGEAGDTYRKCRHGRSGR